MSISAEVKNERKKFSKPLSIFILFGSLIVSVIASLLLGHVLETIFRIVFELTTLGWVDLIIPGIFLAVFLMIGTASLAAAFWVPYRWIQVGIFISNLVLPFIIEIVDLGIRATHVYQDFMNVYSFLF